jgi:multidrug transporter EmrE-like cation transporter
VKAFLVVITSQLLFTAGDLLARLKMRQHGFAADAFLSWWFVGYMTLRTLATFGQLWVLAKLVLGQALPLFAAASVVLSVVLSVTVLSEGLTTKTVVGGGLAVAALLALALPW